MSRYHEHAEKLVSRLACLLMADIIIAEATWFFFFLGFFFPAAVAATVDFI